MQVRYIVSFFKETVTLTATLEVLNFLNATTRYMDSLDWIQGYAWFGFFVSAISHPIQDNIPTPYFRGKRVIPTTVSIQPHIIFVHLVDY